GERERVGAGRRGAQRRVDVSERTDRNGRARWNLIGLYWAGGQSDAIPERTQKDRRHCVRPDRQLRGGVKPHDGRMPSSQLDAVLNAWVVTAGGRSATGVRLPYPRKEGPRVGDMIGQRVDGAPGRQLECLDALRDLHCVDVNPEVGLAHEVTV